MLKPEEKTAEKSQWRQYCEQEYKEQDLYNFDQMLRKSGYHSKRTSWRGIEYDHFDLRKFFLDKGVIKVREHLGIPVDHAVEAEGKFLLEAYQNKVDQWKRWRERKEWGKRQQAQDIERLIASVSADARVEETDMPW